MKKISIAIASLAMLMGANANAATYFCSPTGAGAADGSNWENAFPCEEIATLLEGVEPGDVVYLTAGTYKGISVNVVNGITVIGGFPASAKGTDISGYNPAENKTIFDAEGKNAGNPFIKIQGAGIDAISAVTTVLKGVTITGAAGGNATYCGTALQVGYTTVNLEDVTFKGNTSSAGGVVVSAASNLTAKGCSWIENVNNVVKQDGNANNGASVISGRASLDGVDGAQKVNGYIVLERCVIYGNKIEDGVTASKARYGGLMNLADDWTNLAMVNCLVDGSGLTIDQNGGFARVGRTSNLLLAYNTMYNFSCANTTDSKGTCFSVNSRSPFFMAGNIIVSPSDTKEGVNYAFFAQNDASLKYLSGGYNYVGGRFMNSQPATIWDTNRVSDKWSGPDNWSVLNQKDAFGSNQRTEKNGKAYIEPIAALGDVNGASIKEAYAGCDILPVFKGVSFDFDVDILGNKRSSTTYRGCYDPKGENTAVKGITNLASELVVKSLGNSKWELTATCGVAEVYNVAGSKVMSVELSGASIVDLSELQSGLYLVKVGNRSAKLMK